MRIVHLSHTKSFLLTPFAQLLNVMYQFSKYPHPKIHHEAKQLDVCAWCIAWRQSMRH